MKEKKKIFILIIILIALGFIILLFLSKWNGKYKIYEPGEKIYYNPILNKTCNSNEKDCYTFYTITVDDSSKLSTVDMILDHNLGENVTWGNYTDGPKIALEYLKSQTNDWSSELSVSKKYERTFTSFKNQTYTLDYSGFKARLITVEEIINILKQNSKFSPYWEENDDRDVYNLPDWLLSNTEGVDTSKNDNYVKTNGYWTANPYYNDNLNNYTWIVYGFTGIKREAVSNDMIGIRPVITVSKKNIKSEKKSKEYFSKLNDSIIMGKYNLKIDDYYILAAVNDNVYALYDHDGTLIDQTNYLEEMELLKNGYYTIKTSDNIYLKKDGKLISTNDYNQINQNKLMENCDSKFFNDDRCAVIEYESGVGKTFIYNSKTNEKIKELPGILNSIYIDSKLQYNYYALTKELNDSAETYLLNENLDIVTDKYILADKTRLSVDSYLDLYGDKDLYDDKGIIILKNKKYGVMDYDGNILIEPKYDDIIYNDGYYIVKTKEKYGLVDLKENFVFEANYDAVNVVGNYFITFKNNKITIFDKNKKIIKEISYVYDLKYDYYNYEVSNPYYARKMSDNTIVVTIYKGRKEDIDSDVVSNIIISNNEIYDFKKSYIDGEDNVIVVINEKNTLTLYDQNMKKLNEIINEKLGNIDHIYVDRLIDGIYYIDYSINQKEYKYIYNINKNEFEKVDNAAEFYEKYYYISKNNIISIYDGNGNFIQTLSGNFILKISDKFFLVEISKIGYYRSQYQIYKINK